jgi:hypothetical protein
MSAVVAADADDAPVSVRVTARSACGATWVVLEVEGSDTVLQVPLDPEAAAKLGRMLIEGAATAHGAAVAMMAARVRTGGVS